MLRGAVAAAALCYAPATLLRSQIGPSVRGIRREFVDALRAFRRFRDVEGEAALLVYDDVQGDEPRVVMRAPRAGRVEVRCRERDADAFRAAFDRPATFDVTYYPLPRAARHDARVTLVYCDETPTRPPVAPRRA